jgi:hypothetical protein
MSNVFENLISTVLQALSLHEIYMLLILLSTENDMHTVLALFTYQMAPTTPNRQMAVKTIYSLKQYGILKTFRNWPPERLELNALFHREKAFTRKACKEAIG